MKTEVQMIKSITEEECYMFDINIYSQTRNSLSSTVWQFIGEFKTTKGGHEVFIFDKGEFMDTCFLPAKLVREVDKSRYRYLPKIKTI